MWRKGGETRKWVEGKLATMTTNKTKNKTKKQKKTEEAHGCFFEFFLIKNLTTKT